MAICIFTLILYYIIFASRSVVAPVGSIESIFSGQPLEPVSMVRPGFEWSGPASGDYRAEAACSKYIRLKSKSTAPFDPRTPAGSLACN